MPKFRTIVFYVFVAVYLAVCPLTILYAFGYVLKPGSERGLVKTGLIHLSTTPPGATIYVSRRRFTKTTPATLQGLLPGQYTVRLVLKGHRPWERVIPVEGEKASVLDTVWLLPFQLTPTRLWPEPVDTISILNESRLLVMRRGPRVSDTLLYDMRDEQVDPLTLEEPGFSESRILEWTSVKGSPWTLLRVQAADGARWLWTEPRRGESPVEDVTNLLYEVPERVLWEPSSRRHLFAYRQGAVDRIDTVSKSVVPKWAQRIRGIGLSGRSVYLVNDQGLLARMDRDGKRPEPLAELPLVPAPLIGPPSFYDVRVLDADAILVLGSTGDLLSAAPPHPLAEKVVDVAWDSAHRRALCWTQERIGIVEFHQPSWEGVTIPPQLEWVFTDGRRITEAWWAFSGSHVIFRDDGALMLLALDPYGPPRVETLGETQRAGNATYVEEQGAVYFLDAASGAPSSLQLVPKRERLGLPDAARWRQPDAWGSP